MRAWAFRSSSFWAAASFSFERWPFVGRVVSCVGRVLKERCCLPRCSSSGTEKIEIPRKIINYLWAFRVFILNRLKTAASKKTHTHTHTYSGVECKIKNINFWSECAAICLHQKFVKIFVSVFLQSMKIYTWQKSNEYVSVCGSECEWVCVWSIWTAAASCSACVYLTRIDKALCVCVCVCVGAFVPHWKLFNYCWLIKLMHY